MEITLVLRERAPGRLVYTIPLWYRLVMALISAILAASIYVSGDGKGSVVSWIIVAIAVLAALYEETWILDKATGALSHRFGLVFLARTVSLPLERIQAFRLRAFYKGSNPGSPASAGESAAILASLNADSDLSDLKGRNRMRRKAYITLICDDREGGGLVINTLPMRGAGGLKTVAARFAQEAGVDLLDD